MHVIEFAAVGVRGLSPSVRVSALRPGYVVLKPPAGGPAPLCGLLTALLYADGRGGEASFQVPGQKGKVGLSLIGNDQVTYRLMRELGGAGGLYRVDAKTNQSVLVTQDAAEMQQFLRSQVGLPTKSAFEQLLTLSAAHLPSKKPRPRAGQGTAASGSKPMLASQLQLQVTAATDMGAAQAKLAELKRELSLSQEVDKIQFRADEVSSQIFETEQKLKGSEGLKASLKEAEASWAGAPTIEGLGLPVDIVSRIERYPQVIQKRDDALAKLSADREQAESIPTSVEPLTRNQLFWAGVGGGVVFLLAGLIVGGLGRYLSLLDIPAFGFSAFLALRYVDDLQQSERTSRKSDKWAAREKKINDEFDAEAQHIRAAMARLGVEDPKQVIEVLGRKALLLQKMQEYRDQLAALESDPDYVSAAERLQQLKDEQEKLNAELTEKGSYIRDAREVEREIGRVEESILLAQANPQGAPAAPAAAGGPAPQETFEDPSPALLRLASDLFQADVPGVSAIVKERCVQYLTALADKRYTGLELDLEGRATLLAAAGNKLPAGELPGKDLDLFYLALRFSLLEKLSAKTKLPLVLEEVPGSDESKLPLLGRMCKHLGALTQILHATANPGFEAMADLSADL